MQITIEGKATEVSSSQSRNWSLYNIAQTNEKLVALKILNEAVDSLRIRTHESGGAGRPPQKLDNMLKACVIKVFNGFSARRTIPDLHMSYALGYIERVPHFNIICKYMRNPEITEYLHRIYELLAAPLKDVEDTFAADATGFSTAYQKNWMEYRYTHFGRYGPYNEIRNVRRKDFIKLHATCGTNTCIITAAEATKGNCGDSPYFEGMVKRTANTFRLKHVCADAAYLSKNNCRVVKNNGGIPFFKPKHNTHTTFDHKPKMNAWKEMMRFWTFNRKEFEHHYHKRSNIESTFSAMKRKFLPYIRSKDKRGQFNELLCKVVCHNLSVLVNSIFELDLVADFNKIASQTEDN